VAGTPYIVGLTGGIGSGKSAAAAIFSGLGASVVDTDVIAHELTRPGGVAIAPIRDAFGAGFIAADGSLDRVRMRNAAFADAAAKRRLERILHPLIRTVTDERSLAATGPYVIQVIPLLVESGKYRERAQRVLVVDCPDETRIARVMARSKLDAAQVRAIMAAQASRAERLAAADDVIDNRGDLEHLRSQVETLHRRYLEFASTTAQR
jgi:dephospho-CoA kinase